MKEASKTSSQLSSKRFNEALDLLDTYLGGHSPSLNYEFTPRIKGKKETTKNQDG